MCGLVGACTFQERRTKDAVRIGLSSLVHRGPDDEGILVDGNEMFVGLGLRRLAIQDLSSSGHQPMTSQDGRFVISFNGEITNFIELRQLLFEKGFTFLSNSDTEVLLNLWVMYGAQCLELLEGMFAFAVYDRAEKTITLVRDPFGIKPLFFQQLSDGALYFASELPSLLKMVGIKPRVNLQRAVDYLQWGLYDESKETFVEGVEQVLPGHMLTYSLSESNIQHNISYWFPSIETQETSFSNASSNVRELFLDSIRRNLISDVPIGVALSGGIDSSSIAAAIKHLRPSSPFYAFSYIAEGQTFSEFDWIQKAIQGTAAQFHPIVISDSDLARDLDDLVISQGEPFGSTSVYAQWRVFQEVRQDGIVVTLDGQGADEIFAGYDGYPSSRIRSLVRSGNLIQAADFLQSWSRWPGRSKTSALAGTIAESLPDFLYDLLQNHLRERRLSLLNEVVLQELDINLSFPRRKLMEEGHSVRNNYLKQELRSIYRYRGLPALLRHGDRNSMSSSVESRVPFLDRKLVEYTLSLPEEFLIGNNGESKAVFRSAMRGIVPNSILDRKDKIGFETPQSTWLDTVLKQHGEHLNGQFHSLPIFATLKKSERNIWEQLQDKPDVAWRLINFLKWLELFDLDTNI